MDVKQAIDTAKRYVVDLYAEEGVTNLGLEEVEHVPQPDRWLVTVAFSRPWNTPRTRAQEVLENLGAVSSSSDTPLADVALSLGHSVIDYRREYLAVQR